VITTVANSPSRLHNILPEVALENGNENSDLIKLPVIGPYAYFIW